MIIWIVLLNLMKLCYHLKIRSSTSCRVAHVQSMHMQLECGMPLDVRQLQTTTTYICSWMCCCWRIYFEKFRKTCLEFYSLDPLHYYTTPGLAWDAALHMSRVDLQLITDENMYNFVENSIRGGISMISTRHAQANNTYFPDTYDANLPNQILI